MYPPVKALPTHIMSGAYPGQVGREQCPGPAEASRDLVKNEKEPVVVAHLPQHPYVAGVIKPHTTGTLGDWLADDGSDLVAVPVNHVAHLGFPTRVDAGACGRPGSEELLR